MPAETVNKPLMRIVKNAQESSETPADNDQDSATASAVCEVCFGTGVEVITGKGARPCLCRAEDSRRKFLESARIPRRYTKCTLETFKYQPNSSQYKAYELARSLVAAFPYVRRGLLLMGPVGVGKTHLAVGILRGLISKGVPCLFFESGSLLKRIQDSYNPISKTSEMSVLAPVFEAEVLVLDELGATIPTDWVRDTLYQIINARYNDKKLTIFTTNFRDTVVVAYNKPSDTSDEEPERHRSASKTDKSKPYTLEERIGVPLRSRLYEMCDTVPMEGDDFRKKQLQRPL